MSAPDAVHGPAPAGGTRRGGREARGTAGRQAGWRTRLWIPLAGWLVATVLRLLYATLRVRLVDEASAVGGRRAGQRVIAAFWHEGILLVPLMVARIRWPGTPTVMLSGHRDGAIGARALARFGMKAVHGSSTRGWLTALRGLLAAHGRGDDLVVVPDGPRGPRRVAKDGVVQLARATGLPVLPIGAATRPARRLGSWDRTLVPAPFARVVLVMAPPIFVPRDADAEAQRAAHAAVVAALGRANAAAAAALGVRS